MKKIKVIVAAVCFLSIPMILASSTKAEAASQTYYYFCKSVTNSCTSIKSEKFSSFKYWLAVDKNFYVRSWLHLHACPSSHPIITNDQFWTDRNMTQRKHRRLCN